jgi:hypothetical protein
MPVSWWIAHADRTLHEDVPAPPAEVRGFYTDLENMKLVHPLVVSVRRGARREEADGYLQDYRVADRIPLWRLTLPISYQVRLDVPVHGDVISAARQFPHVRLNGQVSFLAIDSGTRIVERLQIAAPVPLAAMTTRQAVQAHRSMLAAIRRRFELPP